MIFFKCFKETLDEAYLQTNAKWLMPVLFGAAKTQRVHLDFLPHAMDNFMAEVGMDPYKSLSTGKFLVFKLNDLTISTYRSSESINDDNNEFTTARPFWLV